MSTAGTTQPAGMPEISVVILNYNGAKWIGRCLDSLVEQTIFSRIEVIVADNRSADGSDVTAEERLKEWPNGKFVQNGGNLGFCEGNNRGALPARGEYLFFLNNDTWLERDCLEKLLAGTRASGAGAATPLVLNYDDESKQKVFGVGFDIFGLPAFAEVEGEIHDLFMPPGCSYLIEAKLFREIGGFDKEIFLYADELDLSWRVWIAGRRCVAVQGARLHHRWAANVNPKGDGKIVEFRTSDSKRYYANRNNLLVVLKNAQYVLLLAAPLQLGLLTLEALAGWVLLRRWGFVRRTYLDALRDCWRLRKHIRAERRRISEFRRRGDIWMLRFLTWRLNRWEELRRLRQFGVPKVTEG
jgi:GT2 family glycosyltransferase